MSYDEKNTWVYGVVALLGYAIYLTVVLGRMQGTPVAEVAYIAPMLWTIGGCILVSILASIVIAIRWPREANLRDERDREIDRAGTNVGQSFLAIGLIAALVLAMFEVDHFWIANAAYLGFALSAVLGSATKLGAYRGSLPW